MGVLKYVNSKRLRLPDIIRILLCFNRALKNETLIANKEFISELINGKKKQIATAKTNKNVKRNILYTGDKTNYSKNVDDFESLATN